MIIPKKIHLTCKDKKKFNNKIWMMCLYKYYKLYPNYEIIVYDNNDIYKIFEKHYPEYLEKIKKIKIGAILADIFRYLILYLEGGIYSDFDCEPLKNIDEILSKDYKYYHGGNDNKYYVYKNKNQIIDNRWDFDHNICDNSKIMNNSNDKNVSSYQCTGHEIGDVSTILCYEFNDDWLDINDIIKRAAFIGNLYDDALRLHNCQICQWFMITKKKQSIFLKMFEFCMKNIDTLINIKKGDKNSIHSVINLTGPSGFTKIVNDNMSEQIKILPSDFFCTGSWNYGVPLTKNSYIKHHYTGTWHKN